MVWFSWTPRAQAPSGLSVAAERNSKACRKLLRSFTKIHNSLRSDYGFLLITQFPAGQEFLLCFHRKSRRVYAGGADIGEAIFEGSCDRGNEKQAEVCGLLPVCIKKRNKIKHCANRVLPILFLYHSRGVFEVFQFDYWFCIYIHRYRHTF